MVIKVIFGFFGKSRIIKMPARDATEMFKGVKDITVIKFYTKQQYDNTKIKSKEKA